MDFIVLILQSSPVIRIHRFPKESGLSGGCLEVVLCCFPMRFRLSGVVLWNSLYQTHTFVCDVAFACYCAHVAAEWLLSAAIFPDDACYTALRRNLPCPLERVRELANPWEAPRTTHEGLAGSVNTDCVRQAVCQSRATVM